MQRFLGHRFGVCLFITLALFAFSSCKKADPGPGAPPPPPVSYNFHVRPILAAKCFSCHGRDALANESGLRLDDPELARAALDSGRHAVVPGSASDSVAWERITATDPDQIMPPPESGHTLSKKEKRLIAQWIDQGAKYEPHWAFRPLPAAVPLPEVSAATWPINGIDHFIMARLDQEHLAPSPPADPLTWLRRSSLDLTGLPPTAVAVESFLTALSGQFSAPLEETADRLLASPSFGEHFASLWLDAVRYADTYNRQSVDLNPQWPYRDWVVRAFNANLPFDQFLTAQLAGDLLEEPTRDQLLATAYHRLQPLEPRGDTPADNQRLEIAAGRVHTFGSAFLGLRLECVRCHDHKIDDISQRDYYSLLAFFNSVPESGSYDPAQRAPAPTIPLPTLAQAEQLELAEADAAVLATEFAALPAQHEASFQAWLSDELALPLIPDLAGLFTFNTRSSPVPNRALGGTSTGNAEGLQFVDGFRGAAVAFDGEQDLEVDGLFPLDRATPWTFSFWLRDHAADPEPVVLLSRGDPSQGIDLRLSGGHLEARLFREWPTNAIAIRTVDPVVPPDEWTMLSWSYDGSSRAAGLRLYINGLPVVTITQADTLRKQTTVGTGGESLHLGGAPGTRGFKDGALDDVHVHARALTPLEIAHLYDGTSLAAARSQPEEQLDALRSYYVSSILPESRQAASALTAARNKVANAEEAIHEIAIMRELPQPRPAHILTRGSINTPPSDENQVTRSTPAFLPGPELAGEKSPLTRLQLAEWLTSPDHPLTARVFVNRIWAHFFGRGLVAEPGEFGLLSAAPSHPALLDWLARDFVDNGWDVKRLCKQIVLSATYRQASADRSQPIQYDPDNHLLSRGPGNRREADLVRDLALAASGLLDPALGGPPFPRDHHNNRRSLYSIRPHAPALPLRIDGGEDPDRCLVDYTRPAANPTAPANDGTIVRAARALAAQALKRESSDEAARLRFLYLSLAGRPPTALELTERTTFLADQRSRFSENGTDAPRLIQGGASSPDASIDPQELASWTVLCQQILTSEAVTWNR